MDTLLVASYRTRTRLHKLGNALSSVVKLEIIFSQVFLSLGEDNGLAVPSLVELGQNVLKLGQARSGSSQHGREHFKALASLLKLLRTWSSKCASVAMLYMTVPKWDTLSQAPLSSTGFTSLICLGHTPCSVGQIAHKIGQAWLRSCKHGQVRDQVSSCFLQT